MSVPYYSQFETPALIPTLLADGFEKGLPGDPLWHLSGAADQAEYVRWAANVCGMACLKMVLAARTGAVHPTLALARQCTRYGGYVVNPDDGAIRGLNYAPFPRFVAECFGLDAKVVTGVEAADLPGLMAENGFFMASVHPAIRWPDRDPPAKGGHLVLVTTAAESGVVFHNPSGHTPHSQIDVAFPLAGFDRFFAGRGIAIA